MSALLILARLALLELLRHRLAVMPLLGGMLYAVALVIKPIPEPVMLQEVAAWWIGTAILPLLGSLLAVLAGAGLLSSEVERGTILLLATKPAARWQIVLGKALGAWAFIGGSFAFWALLGGLAGVLKHGPTTGALVALQTLEAGLAPALFVAIAMAASARLPALAAAAVGGTAWIASYGAGFLANQPQLPFPPALVAGAKLVERLIPAGELRALIGATAVTPSQALAIATIGIWLAFAAGLFQTRDLSA